MALPTLESVSAKDPGQLSRDEVAVLDASKWGTTPQSLIGNPTYYGGSGETYDASQDLGGYVRGGVTAAAEPAPAPAIPAPTLADIEPYEYTPYELKPPEITPETAPEYKAPAAYTPSPEATVEGRMEGLLKPGSVWRESASQRAKEALAPRGLLNTTMMGTAGERAAIEKAIQIAQPDAAAFQEAGMAGYRGEIAGATAAQKHGQDVSLVGEQAKYSSLLSAQTAEQDAVTAAKKAKENERLVVLGGNIDAIAAANKATADAEAAVKRAAVDTAAAAKRAEVDKEILEIENDFQATLETQKVDVEERKIATVALSELGLNYQIQVERVQSDPALTAANKATVLGDINRSYKKNADLVAIIYGITLDWG